MKIENRQQVLAAAAIAIVALFMLDRMIVSPLITGWKERTARIADLRKSITQGETTLKRAPILRDRWEQMKTNTLAADNAERKLLEAFQRWSKQSNISISSILPQWKQDEDFMTLECHANASGPVSAMAQFLYQIERDPMALRIESLEINSRDESGQTVALALQVSGLVLGAPAP